MRLKKPKEKEPPKLVMEPMVDCVFLLLIFFMVANILKPTLPFSVELPDSKSREEYVRKKFNVYINANGQMSVDDQAMRDYDALEDYLLRRVNEIETLMIHADKNTKHGDVIDAMERAKHVMIDNIAFVLSDEEIE